jgi:hypothetical protein
MVVLASHADFKALLRHEGAEGHFAYVDPPFNFNHPDVAKYPPEVTGHFLLNSLCRRIGWSSLNGRRLLDFGCGVRFPRAIVNLAIKNRSLCRDRRKQGGDILAPIGDS